MAVELRHIHKHFGPVHANDDISLSFADGRIIGILGENGAGKSTLMKILSGFQPADAGEIHIDGRRVDYHGPQAALAQGIGMLQQDPLDVGAFSVLENFIYGQWGGFLPGRQQALQQLREICGRFGFTLDPERPVALLSIAQRQQLEIVRVLALGVKVLILDEPTTGISAEQKNLLFDTLRSLARNDGMTILLVSHKLEDVLALCDEVVVLRSGRVTGQLTLPATRADLVRLMFGQELAAGESVPVHRDGGTPVFEMKGLHLQEGRLSIRDFSLTIHEGEVIGLAGLEHNGQELLMRACVGLVRAQRGQLYLRGGEVTGKSYRALLRSGVVFSAAGRLEEGLIAGLTLTEHLAIVNENGLFVNWKRAREITERQIDRYRVRGRPEDCIETLSGGNQQRVLMAMLPDQPLLMVLEQPTRGLDVESAGWIWEQILQRREHGTSVIFSSADLDELVAYSDRIVVCHAGHIFIVEDPRSTSVQELGYLIGGSFEEQQS